MMQLADRAIRTWQYPNRVDQYPARVVEMKAKCGALRNTPVVGNRVDLARAKVRAEVGNACRDIFRKEETFPSKRKRMGRPREDTQTPNSNQSAIGEVSRRRKRCTSQSNGGGESIKSVEIERPLSGTLQDTDSMGGARNGGKGTPRSSHDKPTSAKKARGW